ncbi:MAG TPA: non-ribosomal peptide synthase/polyketide synthase, partial [Longimicrobium sp.]|nr:non-ribosomal peptide synthase/polyketide synthase [Longimicrobium sp.]
VLAAADELLPGPGLLDTLRGGSVTVATLPPSVLAVLPADGLPDLRTIVSAGEVVDAATAERWSVGRTFVNAYGPTEVTVCATCGEWVPDGRAPAIGRPLRNVRAYVLDEGGRPAPAGVPGELFVGGIGVARGYLGRPALTAERFVPDPFAFAPGGRLYRTGDRVCLRTDGELEFRGRVDEQVKIRGFRIEPGEVEAALRRCPGVAACVVVVREDAPGERRLVAYAVGEADAGALRAQLRERLPEHMVPDACVVLERLPLTPNGKVDRAALPAPAGAAAGHAPPRTPVEKQLAEIWAEVLGVPAVGVDQPFLELGGTSLRLGSVVARVADAFGVKVAPRLLLRSGTIREIAALVEAADGAVDGGAAAGGAPALVRVPRDGPIPLSFAQEAVWFFEQLVPGLMAYRAQAVIRVHGALDVAALERCLNEIVRRHEIFRTTFPLQDGAPVQRIHAPWSVRLPVHDLAAVEETGREAAFRALLDDEFRRPFDTSALPLVRWRLVRTAPGEHALVMVEHHFVHDGWSFGVFLRELSALYPAFRRGDASPLPEPAVQFADYAAWQRRWMERPAAEAKLRFWEEELAGVPQLALPTDFPRPAALRFRGGTERIRLDPALAAGAREFARAHGATFFSALLTVFLDLLGRYSGQRDFCVGSALANRGEVALEGVIGMVVNGVAIRAGLEGDPTAAELVGRVRDTALRAFEHQDVPFDQVVRRIHPDRTASALPIYQVVFSFHDARMPELAFDGVRLELEEAQGNGSAKFDLQVVVIPRAEQGCTGSDEVVMVWEYNTDLFEPRTVRRMAGHFQTLLGAYVREPHRRRSELELLTAEERRRVVEEWSGAEAADPLERCVHELVEEQAGRTPDAVAVVCGGEALTYRELDARASRLARHLVRAGAGPETRVGIHLERSAEMVVALLAVLKAGAAYLPLDPAYPSGRLEFMLADSGASLLLTQRSLPSLAPAAGVRTVWVDAAASAVEPARPPRTAVTPRNAAYVIYTSGSTGMPKGVVVTHAGVAAFFAGMDGCVGGSVPGTWLAVTRIGFDIHVLELLWTLARGFRVVVQPDSERAVVEAAPARLLLRHAVTHLQCTPSLATLLLDDGGAEALAGVERLLLGGEVLPPGLATRLSAAVPGGVVNLYGPTEATVWATTHPVVATEGSVPIGRPLANTGIYVLDDGFRPQPAGVPGELYIGGRGVARGYLDRPGLTAERFLPDPFAPAPGARLYRTGDRARWRDDGALEFLGRTDAQVKLRGFRVEPGEVRAVLGRHPSVRDCAVVAREDAPGDLRLVAYVVGDADAGVLRDHLRRFLPDYMVPGAIVFLDTLPLLPSGKVDLRALPAPDPGSGERFVAPRTPAEEVLAGIWADVLHLERVGATDDFFALGGHSLAGARMVSRVREVFGAELPLRALFDGPTVAQLAERVGPLQRAGLPVFPPVVPVERGRPIPLSFAQERLWFLDRMEPGDASHNIVRALHLAGALDMPALVRALGEVVRRHEVLRTTFGEVDGQPVQMVAPFAGLVVGVDDLSSLADADREAEVRHRMAAAAAFAYDLAAGPLFRPALLRTGAREYVLLLAMHHLVSDAWSMGVLLRELPALYAAYRDGAGSPLPELAVQYADFAAWQRETLRGEVLDPLLAYWKGRLTGAPPLLELPTDRPRPAVRTQRGARERLELPGTLAERLRARGRGEGATLFMVVLAAFQALLGKYAASDDVVVGTPVAGRTRREVEELIGFFSNTLVLRSGLSGDPSLGEVLRRVREATLGAYEHQELPFETLVAELQPERSLAHTALFQVMFALENAERSAPALPGLELRRLPTAAATSRFDLTLVAAEEPDSLALTLEYSTDLFERGTAARMLEQLGRVLEQFAEDAGLPLSGLELMDEAERRTVLAEWSRAEPGPPPEHGINQLFEAQAGRTPDAVAVVHEDDSLSYRELDARANRLARILRRRGVGPEARVAVCLERSPELVIALLAVLKAGGAYVPLDPTHPPARLEQILADSAASVLLTRETLREVLPSWASLAVVSVDGDHPEIAAAAPEPLEGGAGPSGLAYVMYTSGSTGTPKGVAVEHRGVVRLVRGANYAELAPGEVILQAAPVSFDASTFEIWGALLNGARLVLLPGATVSLEELGHTLVSHGVSTLWLTASLFGAMVEERLEDLRGVRQLLAGGDVLPPGAVRRVKERFPGCRLVNGYGPTENTTFTCCHTVPEGWDGGAVPIGRPVSGTRVYVLDEGRRPLPAGVPGELYAGGAGVARGYLGRPGLTAEGFVPDPFASEPGARLYRTGDRVRWVADGSVEFLGRTDHQVKIRGFRIEPGEIEARLAEHVAVREAVVLVREDTPGEKRLVAYVAGDETAGADVLRAHLSERLPEYMVPAAYVRLDALPLTPNGKIDRKALPAPEGDASPAREYEAPSGKAEKTVAAIWAKLLGADRVGRHDHFFDLGGHSLLAVRVVSRVRQALRVEVSPRDVFERPVLADFARGLTTAMRPEPAEIARVDRTAAIPLSFAQQRLWFLEQLGNLGSTYHIPTRLRLRGDLDRGALVRALDRIVARHEALRTTFPAVDGEPVQRIAPVEESALRLVEHDLRAAPDAEDQLHQLIRDEASAPFDLEHGPLIRGRLVRMAADDHVLLLTMHHIVSDGWSIGVLHRDLGALYSAFVRGEPDPLPPLPVQYADYAAWHRRWVGGPVLEAQAKYWTNLLAGAPELLELPADRPRPARQAFAGASLTIELDEALTAGLKALSRRHRTTLFITLLSGWAVVLSRLAGQTDVVVGMPVANRGRLEIEDLVGFFVNTLALRVELSDAPTVAGLLEQVKARALEAQRHQDIPFEQVVERVRPMRSLAHTPLFQVMFTWQNASDGTVDLPGLQAETALARAQETAKFDLSLALWEDGERIAGGLSYATALFQRETVERWLGYLRRVLEEMVADDSKPVDRLDLLSAAERRMVVEEWSANGAAFSADVFVHELFEAQVERTPGAEAVAFEGERLTYAELNARANRLAHHLRALGVGSDARVGICAERGLEMVVGVLGVLKAGGAYVPLDPSYPAERLAYVLADSAPAAVLVQTHLRDRVDQSNVAVVELDAAEPAWASLPAANPERGALTPNHLAYVIYTSGSTGRPKGVRVAHGNLAPTLAVARDAFGFGAGDRVPSLASFAFDIWLFETLLPLLGGGTVRLIPRERVLDVPRLVADLAWCTTLHAVPVLMRRIVEEVRARPESVLPSLRRAFVGGDAVAPDLLEEMRAAFPAAEIHVLYGPTEAAIICAAHRLGEEAAARQMVGRPLGNAALYVVEPGGSVAPAGVPGELCLGGASVARDYLGRPGLTAERFVPDPFSATPGARLYRTGDRVRWLADGAVEFLGRTDFQVKVRGFRIEPGEIEARLLEHAGVREAVVLVREDTPGEKRLVAYVAGDETATAEVLRAHLGERLPEYMVPAAYVRLDALPLTPNGKVDRKSLPAPEGDAFPARGYEAPSGKAEEAVAAIWAELLGAERVGRRDHFFELGGHSLLAVRVVSRVQQALGVEVSARDVFERPVLADFARGLETAARAEAMAIAPVDRTAAIPLSFAQQRLWFLEQLGNLGGTYNIPMRLRLRGDLDRGALVRSLDRIVARHEALRTTFRAVDGEPVQHIAPVEESAFRLVEHDLRALADAADELRRLVSDEASAPFDLEQGPLIRGRLIRMAADDHVLLLTMHHIVSDGWSTGVLYRELGALYAAFSRNEPDPLPPLPVQYADYAAWHRRWVEGEVLQRQADYWTGTLDGAPELLELPADHPRPARQDFAGASLKVELDEALTAALKTLGHRHGATLHMTLLAGWAAVLSRLSGQDEVVVGTPSANRGRGEIEGLIGFFVNTLPLRVDLSGAPTVAETLGRVKGRALEAQQNQDIPFEQVVELVQPVRSLAHSPLFQAMFVWQNASDGTLELPGLAVGRTDAAPQVTAKFDLLLSLSEDDGRIVGGVEYATSLFEQATLERWLGYLRRVLEAMVADDGVVIDRLPMLPEAERALVLREFNDTRREYPREACVHELFEAQAARTPGAVAVVFEGERVMYAELNARANRLAHHLRALGVGPDARVGICVERSVEMVVGLLGILKAGGAYVPLDASYPVDRLRNMLEDSSPAVLLTHPPLAATVAELAAGSAVPVLDLTHDETRAHQPETNPGREGLGPRNLAHVLFTSGSTGRPKGVMLEHGSLVNRLSWMQDRYGMESGEALLQKTPFSFDVSFWEFFWPLMVGARLVMARPGGHRDPAYLVDVIRREGVTVAHFVPSMLPLFLEHPGAAACTGVLRVPVSGEAVSAALVRQFHERLPSASLFNQYGPTESGEVTEWTCDPDAERVSIGRAIHNSAVYVLDRAGEPLPVGVAGELLIGGVAVARGYLGRPRLTAERFIPDPFGQPGARMYRTGDLSRWLADGTLEYLGRTDFQVKVRGFRVELGEIEARLATHPGVREAVVLALDDGAGGKRLVAYFVGEVLESEALRAHLSTQLPEYMVPAAFVRLDAFPVTPNGKLDRGALPAPDADAFAARNYEAPVGETEQALAAIWSELLGVGRVGRGDHFFDLGGHSLLAVRVVSRVRQALGVEAAIGDLFERPVLADFARGLETAVRAEAPAITPVDRSSAIPLSFAQQRLWFLAQLGGAGGAYQLPWRLRLRGALDREALARALERIVARHESLRTTFPTVDGEPVQRIVPVEESAFRLVEHDLTAAPDADDELRRIMLDAARAPFDLEQGPLFRGRLVRMAADDHALLLTMHHVVSDGWSLGVLEREMEALYTAFARGDADPLPPLPVQYADYAVWQRRQVDGDVLRRQAGYWRETLSGAPELLELPTDHPRPAKQEFAGATVPLILDDELTAGLKALGARHGTTLFMTLLAGWAAVLSRLSGQDDVVVGTPTANRGRAEVEELIGFFVNTLAVRVDLSGSPSVAELLGRVKERSLGAQHHQDMPFEQVVELVQPVRSLAHTPLFQVLFAWQNAPGGSLELPGLALGPLAPTGSSSQMSAKFDLSLALWEDDGRIGGEVTYATALFERETLERWLGYLRRVLEGMVADEQGSVEELELLSDAERRRVVEEFNAGRAEHPREAFVHERFETQVEHTPGAAALVFEDETLSYAELNARSNQLAHHLRSLGVGPDVRVAICVERGPAMVVGALAVLKAGGAYLPLDPAYPAERLRDMLEDGAPVALLTGSALLGLFEGVRIPVLDLEEPLPAWAGQPETNPERGSLAPAHLAYVIYTSGSTGRPKGVRVSHGSVGATLAVAGEAFGFGAGDRVPSLASFAFDIWLFETLLPLLGGGTVRLVPRDRVPDVPRLVEDLAWCTALHAVPALMRRIVEEVRARPESVLPSLRRAFVGGDAVAPDLLAEMRIAFPAADIHVLYGPTEGAIICAAHRLGGEAAARQMVGRPLGNAALYVVERGGRVAPVGVPGELCLGGASVARDYLGRPGLTAERFVPDPFSAEPGTRLYCTGDRVRWLLDGSVEFLGRTDFQVKVRGFRIEPGEIEARLAEHPGVREAVVLVREDTPGEKRLVAYVAGDDTATADVLRAHLSERLPEYMVPAAYVRLDALPLTPNGKVDRKALPAPEGDAFPARGYEAPSGTVEEAVAAIWAELLGTERVGRRDHFFELGGHSLLAVRVVSRVRQALGVEASPRDVFERPALADFARGLEAAAQAEATAIVPVDRTAAIPLSFAQQRLWFLEQLGNLGSTYHMPMRLRLRGELDRGALVRALDRIVARHEVLRTSFPTVNGEPVQHIAPVEESGFRLVEHDLSGILPLSARNERGGGWREGPDAADELRRVMRDEASAPFDLAQGPLFRSRLVRMAVDDHVLLLTMHHIVSDGWSAGVLFRELGALYTAFSRGEPDPLPPLQVQYADYAVWHRRWVDGQVLEAQADYWTQTLAGAPELLELPTDHPRPAKQDFTGAAVNVELDEALTAALRALSQRHGTTLFMTLLAGWAAVLARLSGQDDVVIGTPSANRGYAEVEELIGFFVNTLPLRVDLSDGPRVGELLARVKERALEAQRNQDIPFEQVVERVRPVRSLAYTPLFQVMFAWQNAPNGTLELPGLAVGGTGAAESDTAKFDLSLTLWEDGGRIEGAMEYATALFDRATVERHLVYLRRALEAMAADDLQAVDALALLPQAERRLVVEEWNRTDAEEPRDACVHALFEAQVARAPDAVALVQAGEVLTYAGLNRRANQLAHHLAGRGVGPDARVAICASRTPELVVGLLAILKAGGAYVPLDPEHPRERLRYLLDDSAPVLVLTQRALRERFAATPVPVVALDEDAPAWAREPEHDPARAELTP